MTVLVLSVPINDEHSNSAVLCSVYGCDSNPAFFVVIYMSDL
jgi:hypothetical protein